MSAIINQDQFRAIESHLKTSGLSPEVIAREMSHAKQAWESDANLQKCDPRTIVNAVCNVANFGVTLNPIAKQACLIARWNGRERKFEATLEVEYGGLISAVTDSGFVTAVIANAVYEGDNFAINIASTNDPVTHNPCLQRSKRGAVIGSYAIAVFQDGTKSVEWLDMDDLEKIRECSESWKNEKARPYSPWSKWFDRMAVKSAIRRLCNYLPRQAKSDRLLNIIEHDNKEYGASFQQIGLIDNLLRDSTLNEEIKQAIESEMHDYTYQQAQAAIDRLKQTKQTVRENGVIERAKTDPSAAVKPPDMAGWDFKVEDGATGKVVAEKDGRLTTDNEAHKYIEFVDWKRPGFYDDVQVPKQVFDVITYAKTSDRAAAQQTKMYFFPRR